MHSFLQSSTTLPEDQHHLHIRPDVSIGIDEIRTIQTFLSKKPTNNKQNVVIIHSAHLLTVPAQHALLKTLEEPPGNSQIYLITAHPDTLLPTILSRVQIIKSPYTTSVSSTTYEIDKFLGLQSIGDRIKFLEAQKFTRLTLGDFLDQTELSIHNDLIHLSHLFPLIHQSKKYLKANCNLRLILTHLATNL